MQYVNEGCSIMLALTCTLYFLKEKVEPKQTTIYLCYIMLPETFSFLFGWLGDTIGFRGKRGHIVIAACLQIASSLLLFFHKFEDMRLFILVAAILVTGKAWMTPVIESLMIVQMK